MPQMIRGSWESEGLTTARSSRLRVSRGETRGATPVSGPQRLGSLRTLAAYTSGRCEFSFGEPRAGSLGLLAAPRNEPQGATAGGEGSLPLEWIGGSPTAQELVVGSGGQV